MPSLRITSGELKGRRVPVPARDVRPTSERARQAYFNIVGDRIRGARFLDLFAGSGIFSFEALSRGAAAATAIDRDRRHTTTIAKEAATLGVPVNTITSDVVTAVKRLREPFDLVYADPPFDFEDYDELVRAVADLELSGEALVAVEHRRGSRPFVDIVGKLAVTRRAEYGEVWITFFGVEAATGIAESN
jgi:16S rRNA (guanine966-N2)-methyltransferase